jgi:hypothetical protein
MNNTVKSKENRSSIPSGASANAIVNPPSIVSKPIVQIPHEPKLTVKEENMILEAQKSPLKSTSSASPMASVTPASKTLSPYTTNSPSLIKNSNVLKPSVAVIEDSGSESDDESIEIGEDEYQIQDRSVHMSIHLNCFPH